MSGYVPHRFNRCGAVVRDCRTIARIDTIERVVAGAYPKRSERVRVVVFTPRRSSPARRRFHSQHVA